MDYERGIVNMGNSGPLRRALDRAAAGQRLTVGFIGGSITQGSLASAPERCYANLVFRWFAERYPNARYRNAGIGGTTSQFAVARVEEDLLQYGPDIVFVEFSVNDACTEHFRETFEGLIRRILKSGAAPVVIHNICYDTGTSAEDVHLPVAVHYEIPAVSVRSSIYAAVLSGALPVRQITPDDLHPNDAGHACLAELICYLLQKLSTSEPGSHRPLPQPLTANHFENSVRYQNHNTIPVIQGFIPDQRPQNQITQLFRRGFTAHKKGDRITFQIRSTCLAVQYRKSIRKPAPIARVIVDGDAKNAVILDANFQETWGDCLYLQTIFTHQPLKTRNVEIQIIETHESDAVPFYLVSVIGSQQNPTGN